MSIRAFIDPRRLDQRITLQRNTPTQNSTGEPVDSWATLIDNVPAAVDALKANSEVFTGGVVLTAPTYTFWIRADVFVRFHLTDRDRIVWRGELFNISAAPDQQLTGRFIAILATTGKNQG
jgi:SPP1 family predicted phage head-tail adaptor